jgi:hypothetical protein
LSFSVKGKPRRPLSKFKNGLSNGVNDEPGLTHLIGAVQVMKPFHCLASLLLLTSASAFCGQVKTEDDAIKLATQAIHKFHLTTLKDECGAVDVNEQPAYFEVVVRERHTQSCGGSLETGPRLFTVRVRKRDGQLTSDVYDGTSYKPLNHQPGQRMKKAPAP